MLRSLELKAMIAILQVNLTSLSTVKLGALVRNGKEITKK